MPEMTIQQAIELGKSRQQAGQFAEAESIYRQVLAAAPEQPEALHLLGLIAFQHGQIDAAIDMIQRATIAMPDAAHFHTNLAQVLTVGGRLDDAITVARRALALEPDHPQAWHHLGVALQQLGRIEPAIDAFGRALASQPNYPQATYNLGNALMAADRMDNAIAAFRRTLSTWPELPEAHNNLGNALYESGRIDEAIASHRQALSLRPDWAMAHYNLGVAHLLKGEFDPGWQEYEWRCRAEQLAAVYPVLSIPRWDGSDPMNRRILVCHEQGLGDTIQFVRYLPMLAARGARITLQCQPELERTLRGVDGIQSVVTARPDLQQFDFHSPLLSLPLLLGTHFGSIPYLRADPENAARWRDRIDSSASTMKVGLVWAGSARHTNDRNRSLPLSALAPLAEVATARYYTLQKRSTAAEEKSTNPLRHVLLDWTDELSDFADTAALIDNLDLVISVDTAVAHLAGAMGKPVWVLLQFVPDWRWMLDREDSPWYPTMRLFRQPAPGDWETPLRRVVAELQCLK